MPTSTDDLTALSRSGTSSPFGKRTEPVKGLVSMQTKEDFRRLWISLGYQTESEFIAHLVEIRTYGLKHVQTIAAQRLAGAAGISLESDGGGDGGTLR